MGVGDPSSYTDGPRGSKLVNDAEVNSVELCTILRGRTCDRLRGLLWQVSRTIASEAVEIVPWVSVGSVLVFSYPLEDSLSISGG